MPTRKGAALSEFHRSVHHVTSTKSFTDKFNNLSQSSDRQGMIKILMEIDRAKILKIEESYHGKDEEEARRMYEKYRSMKNENGERENLVKIGLLDRALFAANSRTSLFARILLERARYWYFAGAFVKCVKDCDYLTSLTSYEYSEIEMADFSTTEENIGCNDLKAKCNERLKRSNKLSLKQGRKSLEPIATIPRIDGRSHGKLRSCGDSVKLAYDRIRGRHLVATRNIKNGSVLIVDEPFSFSTDRRALRTNCLHCHVSLDLEDIVKIPCDNCQTVAYCSIECKKISWTKYHRYECTIFDYFYETNVRDIDMAREHRSHLLLAWRTTLARAIDLSTNNLDDEFLNYQEILSNEEKGDRQHDATIEPYEPHDYRTVFALETHCSDSSSIVNLERALRSIFLAKCLDFVLAKSRSSSLTTIMKIEEISLVAVGILRHIQSVDCNAYEIVENTRDERTRIWEPRNVGGAIYTTVSLVNHSCYPNVVRHTYPGGKVVVRALRFIPKGTEILDCYGPHFVIDSVSSRRRYLQEKYHFSCICEACTKDFQLPQEDATTCYNCPNCGIPTKTETLPKCTNCKRTIDVKKLEIQLSKSTKKRVTSIAKMLRGNYSEALHSLLEHGNLVDKILVPPSLEAIKTQQSIVQCYNSFSSTSPAIYITN